MSQWPFEFYIFKAVLKPSAPNSTEATINSNSPPMFSRDGNNLPRVINHDHCLHPLRFMDTVAAPWTMVIPCNPLNHRHAHPWLITTPFISLDHCHLLYSERTQRPREKYKIGLPGKAEIVKERLPWTEWNKKSSPQSLILQLERPLQISNLVLLLHRQKN